MTEIYVVIGEETEGCLVTTWLVAAYTGRAEAEQKVSEMTSGARQSIYGEITYRVETTDLI